VVSVAADAQELGLTRGGRRRADVRRHDAPYSEIARLVHSPRRCSPSCRRARRPRVTCVARSRPVGRRRSSTRRRRAIGGWAGTRRPPRSRTRRVLSPRKKLPRRTAAASCPDDAGRRSTMDGVTDLIRAARAAKRAAKRRREPAPAEPPPAGSLVSQGARSSMPVSRRQPSADDAIRAAYYELAGRRVIRLDV
jgi:hypothetical protein